MPYTYTTKMEGLTIALTRVGLSQL